MNVSINGVVAYCNDLGESDEYQCDQFANRVMSSLNLPPVDDWVNNLACEICDMVSADPALNRLYSVWGPEYRDTAGHLPSPNDLLVWWEPASGCKESNKASPGHVAVVTRVSADRSYIEYMQQNWMADESIAGSVYAGIALSSAAWDPVSNFFGHAGGSGGEGFAPKCWIHPECPPGTSCNPGPTHNPCRNVTHANNGQYCGKSNQAGFNRSFADPRTLYECIDGQIANEIHCPSGCYVADNGVSDGCNSP
jgi:hypothetical protein